jgi:hypothetical protein
MSFNSRKSSGNISNDCNNNDDLVVITNQKSDHHWDYVLKEMVSFSMFNLYKY